MDVRFELLADDLWPAEDDRTDLLNVGVYSFIDYVKERPIYLNMEKISTKKRKYDKWG